MSQPVDYVHNVNFLYMGLYFIYFKKYWQKKQMAEAEVAEAEAGWGWDGNFSYKKLEERIE